MIKTLIVNGCSLTRGQELDDPLRDCWPALLSRSLGVTLVNLAQDGGSNRRLVRTTIEKLSDICGENEILAHQWLFIGLWTGLDRHEVFRDDSQDPGVDAALPAYDRHWHMIGPWAQRDRKAKVAHAFYRHLWSEEGQRSGFLLDWVLLDAFMGSNGYHARYAFAYPIDKLGDGPAGRLAACVDRRRVFGGLSGRAEDSFEGLTTGLPRGLGHHPLAASHQMFSRTLENWLRSDPTLTFPETVDGVPGL